MPNNYVWIACGDCKTKKRTHKGPKVRHKLADLRTHCKSCRKHTLHKEVK